MSKTASDAIIVFGGGINQDGTLNPDSTARVEEAVKLWREKLAPVILFCGKWSFSRKDKPLRTEAMAMAELATQLGCPQAHILLEERSTDTIGNAYFAKTLFAIPRGWKKIVVVIADYHYRRSKLICQKVFGSDYEINIVQVPLDLSADKRADLERRERAAQAFLEEQGAQIKDGDDPTIWQILSTRHPGYATNPEISTDELRQMIAAREEKLS